MIPSNPRARQAQRHQVGERLGDRPVPVHVVRIGTGADEGILLAGARLQKSHGLTSDEISAVVSCARILAHTPHRNLAPAMQPVIGNDEVLILNEFVDGESLESLCRQGARPTLRVWLRVLLDVLAGLHALHAVCLRDGEPAGFFHSEVTPSSVVVGVDGVSRLIHTCRIPGLVSNIPAAQPYMAPEVLLHEPDVDQRADVYSVGALLWEALAGEPLFRTENSSAIIRTMLTGALPAARCGPDAPWAKDILPVADRALSLDRAARFASVEAMRREIEQRAVGHVASREEVSRLVCGVAGAQVLARRERHGGGPIALPKHAPAVPEPPQPPAPPVAPKPSSPGFAPPGVAPPGVFRPPGVGLPSFPGAVGRNDPHAAPVPSPVPALQMTPDESPKRRSWLWIATVASGVLTGVLIVVAWGLLGRGEGESAPKPAPTASEVANDTPVAAGEPVKETPAPPAEVANVVPAVAGEPVNEAPPPRPDDEQPNEPRAAAATDDAQPPQQASATVPADAEVPSGGKASARPAPTPGKRKVVPTTAGRPSAAGQTTAPQRRKPRRRYDPLGI